LIVLRREEDETEKQGKGKSALLVNRASEEICLVKLEIPYHFLEKERRVSSSISQSVSLHLSSAVCFFLRDLVSFSRSLCLPVLSICPYIMRSIESMKCAASSQVPKFQRTISTARYHFRSVHLQTLNLGAMSIECLDKVTDTEVPDANETI
jgi:hypothetical protein